MQPNGAMGDHALVENTLRQLLAGSIPPSVVSFLATELPARIECSTFLGCMDMGSDPETISSPEPKPAKGNRGEKRKATKDEPPAVKMPRIPPEIIDNILRLAGDVPDYTGTDDWWEYQRTLRVFSLVCKEWCALARQILWSLPQVFQDEDSIKRYMDILATLPHLARHVNTIDLLSIESKWSSDSDTSYFRKAACLLRQTPNCTSISLLHVALCRNVRRRIFGALGALRIKSATFYSMCWSTWRRARLRTSHESPNVDALMKLLCRWKCLENLSLTGYIAFPLLFSPESLPRHTIPQYSLKSLELVTCEFETSTLFWLLGSQPCVSTLQRLEIHHVSGLRPSDLETVLNLVAPSLKVLKISITEDCWNAATPANQRKFTRASFSQLHHVEVLSLAIEGDLETSIISFLGQLASLRSLAILYVRLSADDVSLFLDQYMCPLVTLTIGGGGNDLEWTNNVKYAIASKCNGRGINVSIDDIKFEEMEAAWHGIGTEGIELCSDTWAALEKANPSPKPPKNNKQRL